MIKGLYTSAMGLSVLTKQHEVTANNLANANTSGYKKDVLVSGSFPEMLLYKLNDPEEVNEKPRSIGGISMGVKIEEVYTDHTTGNRRSSENASALAVSEGYFTVNTPQGERYTRNGEFGVDSAGRVVSPDGYPLMGQKGEIIVKGSDFRVDREGRVYSGGVEIDSLKIVNFSGALTKEGSSLFQGEDPEKVATPLVSQGFVEESNVEPIGEMINMIEVMRAYEANQKVIQTIDTTLDKAVNEVGRV